MITMSDRSFRDRLARIADNIDLEQLDGLVNRVGPDVPEEEQPNLHRLIMNLEQNEPVVVDVRGNWVAFGVILLSSIIILTS